MIHPSVNTALRTILIAISVPGALLTTLRGSLRGIHGALVATVPDHYLVHFRFGEMAVNYAGWHLRSRTVYCAFALLVGAMLLASGLLAGWTIMRRRSSVVWLATSLSSLLLAFWVDYTAGSWGPHFRPFYVPAELNTTRWWWTVWPPSWKHGYELDEKRATNF